MSDQALREQVEKLEQEWRGMAEIALRNGPILGDEIGHASRWTAIEHCADELSALLSASRPPAEPDFNEQQATVLDRLLDRFRHHDERAFTADEQANIRAELIYASDHLRTARPPKKRPPAGYTDETWAEFCRLKTAMAVECDCRAIEKCSRCEAIDALAASGSAPETGGWHQESMKDALQTAFNEGAFKCPAWHKAAFRATNAHIRCCTACRVRQWLTPGWFLRPDADKPAAPPAGEEPMP